MIDYILLIAPSLGRAQALSAILRAKGSYCEKDQPRRMPVYLAHSSM